MKRTKNMYENPTTESHELFLFCENEWKVYRQWESIKENLERKIKKGIYDSNKAIDLFYYLADNASKLYKSAFGGEFTVNERFNCAIELRNEFETEMDI